MIRETIHSYSNPRRRGERKRDRRVLEKNNVPFLNLRCKMDIQIHRAQRTTKELNLKKTVLRCIIAYLTKVKDKERPLKAERKATLP